VNADFFLVALAAPFLPAWGRVLAYGTVLLNDFVVSLGPIYHFQIGEILRWLSDLAFVSPLLWLPMTVALFAASYGVAYLAIRLAGNAPNMLKTAIATTAIGTVICAADIANGTSFVSTQSKVANVGINLAYSGGRKTFLSVRSLMQGQGSLAYSPLRPEGFAAAPFLDAAKKNRSKDQLVLALVESMSLFKDQKARDALVSMFHEKRLNEKYDITFEDIPFEGHTINGEFRELCGVRMERFGEKGIPECLPHYLKAQGYETLALHGFSSEFYDRYQWYPKLEFNRILFADGLYQAGVKEKCGASFSGLCDTGVADLLHQELLSATPEHKKFIYWMTLNSHLPLNDADAAKDTFDCSVSPATRESDAVCAHTRMVHLVLKSLADLASDPKLPPTRFVIVGDHMVPFMQPSRRALYDPAHVPAVLLTPKKGS